MPGPALSCLYKKTELSEPLSHVLGLTRSCLLQPAAAFTEFSGLKKANALRCGRQEQTLASRVATQATTVSLACAISRLLGVDSTGLRQ